MPSHIPRLLTTLASLLALASSLACGGAVDQTLPGEGAEPDAATDAGLDAGIDSELSCLILPVAGDPCTTSTVLCSWPPPPNCVGPIWQCIAGAWEYADDALCSP